MNDKKTKSKLNPRDTRHSYKPKTNKRSNKLATKHRIKMLNETESYINDKMKKELFKRGGKITHADLLVYHKRAREKKLLIKQRQKR